MRHTPRLSNEICSYCAEEIAASDHVSRCSWCGTSLHESCWIANGRCTTLGCPGHPGPVVRAASLYSGSRVVWEDANSEIGKTCPFCQTTIGPGVPVVRCSECDMPHHEECWRHNRGCTTFGCPGTFAEPSTPAGFNSSDSTYPERSTQGPTGRDSQLTTHRRLRLILALLGALIAVGIVLAAIHSDTGDYYSGPGEYYTDGGFNPDQEWSAESPEETDGATQDESETGELNTEVPSPRFSLFGIPARCRAGDPFVLRIIANNRGVAADNGSVTVSFSEDVVVELLDAGSGDFQQWNAGKKITRFDSEDGLVSCSTMEAYEPGAEVYFRDGWETGLTRTVSFNITPLRAGDLAIRVRFTLTLSSEKAFEMDAGRFYNFPDPTDADDYDQQGLPVQVYCVEIY